MGANGQTILWHIPISHYSEKVRWALDLKGVDHERRAPMPGAHMPIALVLTRGRHYTLPILELDGRRIGDSTAIIAALEERFPEPRLYPEDPGERRRALELEEWFDEEVGPYMRRFAFHEMRREPEVFDAFASQAAPEMFARAGRAAGVFGRAMTGARYGARDAEAAERAREKVLAGLDRLEAELGGRDHLVGDGFTVADLTAAALLYPLVFPPEVDVVAERLPERYERVVAPWRERPAGRWVSEMFRRHRRRAAAAAAV